MKRVLFSLLLATGLLSAAAQQKKSIEGNGKLVTRDVAVKSFNELDASGIFELKILQGSTESVKLEGDENILEYISVKNDGSTLEIDMDKLNKEHANFKPKNKLKVYVTFKDLRKMDLSMIGNVNSTDQLTFDNLDIKNTSVGNLDLTLTAKKVSLTNQSVGNVTLTGKSDDVVVKNSSVGDLKAGNFAVQTMTIENSGVGSIEVNAAKNVKVNSTGIGGLKNKGAAPMPNKKHRGATVVI